MSVASCDQVFGISAPRVANTTDPSGLLITLSRASYSTAASGSTPPVVYRRSTWTPGVDRAAAASALLREPLGALPDSGATSRRFFADCPFTVPSTLIESNLAPPTGTTAGFDL